MNGKITLCFIPKKRLKLMLLTLFCTILLVIYAFSVSASETAILKVGQAAAKPGETVNITLTLENNPGIAGLLIKIKYDASRLYLDGANAVTRGTALSNLTYIGVSEVTSAHNPFAVLWYGVTNDSGNGVILNVRFTVLSDAPAGEAAVSVTYEPNDAVSDSGGFVALSVQNAAVTVMRDSSSVAPPNNSSENLPSDIDISAVSDESESIEVNSSYMPDNYVPENAEQSADENPVFNIIYSDVTEKDWFFDAVYFVTAHRLFEGIGGGLFAPSDAMTRAMFITVLARLDGANLSQYKTPPYSDTAISTWYGPAIAWAAQSGIIDAGILSGYQAGTFKPGDNITREQMAVIFNNYIRITNLSLEKRESQDFADTEQASDWAKPAINSMRSRSIINGIGNNLYNPKGTATRAEVAQIFTNLIHAMIE